MSNLLEMIDGTLKSTAVHNFNAQAEKLITRLKGEIERISGLCFLVVTGE